MQYFTIIVTIMLVLWSNITFTQNMAALRYDVESIKYEIRNKKVVIEEKYTVIPRLYTIEVTYCRGQEEKRVQMSIFATIPSMGEGGLIDDGMGDKINSAPYGWYGCGFNILDIK